MLHPAQPNRFHWRPVLATCGGTVVLCRAQARRSMSSLPSRGMENGLVSCEWLRAELDAPSAPLRLVEATWYLPNSPFAAPEGSEGPQAEFMAGPRLPGAGFFDIDGVATPHSVPHMLPDEETFAAAMAALQIEPGTRVVAYDRLGVFSSPRFWYTLKVAFGHPAEVAVLDGGLPRWKELGYPLEEGPPPEPAAPAKMARWSKVQEAVWDKSQVIANCRSGASLHLDARPAPRFHGEAPEPRPGMRLGHAPRSVSLPAGSVLKGTMMLPKEDLMKVAQSAGVSLDHVASPDGPRILTSCGSGLTACVIGLGLHQLGMPLTRWAVYDGSWAEWGADQETPIMKRAADGGEEVVPPLK